MFCCPTAYRRQYVGTTNPFSVPLPNERDARSGPGLELPLDARVPLQALVRKRGTMEGSRMRTRERARVRERESVRRERREGAKGSEGEGEAGGAQDDAGGENAEAGPSRIVQAGREVSVQAGLCDPQRVCPGTDPPRNSVGLSECMTYTTRIAYGSIGRTRRGSQDGPGSAFSAP
jgi:hypothetical protein